VTAESFASSEFLKSARPPYPYPGLRPFERDEWSIFFGRERMIDEVIERLAAYYLVFIHGASGSGKSSLVRAGVLPKLARQHLGAGAPWCTFIMRPSGGGPSAGPLWNLASGLAALDGRSDDLAAVDEIMRHMNRRGATLSSIAASIKALQGQRLCILVDQFEELFRFERETSRAEAELFVDLLVRSSVPAEEPDNENTLATAHAPHVHVVVTMRSEFLGECARFNGLAEAINETQYLVPRMDRESLLRAIRRPAMLYDGEVPLDLAERLMADVAGTEDELPLIQHGLLFMWNAARAQTPSGKIVLDGAAFEDAGGLAQLLSRHADAVIEQAAPDPERRNAVERLFRAVADLSVEGKAIRRPRPFEELVKLTGIGEEKLRGIINVLRADAVSFLTPYAPQPIKPDTTIDISHESLIRQWQKLSRWVENERRAGEDWQRLRGDAGKKFFLNIRELANALAFGRKVKPNEVWAWRYGGGFESVKKLVSTSIIANSVVALLLIGVVSGLGWLLSKYFSQTTIIAQNFQTAVNSAQTLLLQISDSLNRGDITVKGAKAMLPVGTKIVKQVKDVQSTPQTIALVIELAHTASDISVMLGDLTAAYEQADSAREQAEGLRAKEPNSPDFVRLAYNSIWRMADAISSRSLDLQDQEEALGLYLQALELARKWGELRPGDTRPQRELMFIRQKIGDVRQVQKDWPAAVSEYTEALRLIKNVVAASPQDLERQADLANTLSRIGQALVGKRDLQGALDHYKQAFEIRTMLVKNAPYNDVFVSNRASSLRELAGVYVLLGDFDAALTNYKSAIDIREGLLHKDSGNAYWQITLAPLYTELGGVLKRRGDLPGALAQFRKSYALRQDLAKKDPFSKDRQNNFAIAGINVADVLAAQKQEPEEAIALYRDAIKILDEARPKYDGYVFHCYLTIGEVLNGEGKPDEAYQEYQIATGIARTAAEKTPGSALWQRNLRSAIITVGEFLVEERRKAEALDHYQQALQFVESLAAKYPNIPAWAELAKLLHEKMEALRT